MAASTTPAYAETPATASHSTFAQKSLSEVLGRDVMGLPEAERDLWLHGVITGLSVAYATSDKAASRCLTDWAFDEGDGLSVLPGYLNSYPEEPAYSVVFAVAKRACPAI